MDNPVRILHVLGRMDRGGAEAFVMNIYRNIDRTKVQFDFVVHTENECDYDQEIRKLGGVIYHAPRYKGINHLAYVKWWKQLYSNHLEYKVVHGHIRSVASIYLQVAKQYGRYTIIHSHSTSNGNGVTAIVKNYLQRNIPKYADTLIACSELSGQWLYKGKKFDIIKNGIDLDEYSFDVQTREHYRRDLGIDNSTLLVGHVGRFHEAKNHLFLIDVFQGIHAIRNDSKLILVGDGDLRHEIEDKINKLGIRENVILTGVRKDIPKLLQAMDVFVFPSKWEGFPVSLLEAQASGLPCYVSDSVTSEAFIADNLKAISLEMPPSDWVKIILSNKNERVDNFEKIKTLGYDIHDEAQRIERFYLKHS